MMANGKLLVFFFIVVVCMSTAAGKISKETREENSFKLKTPPNKCPSMGTRNKLSPRQKLRSAGLQYLLRSIGFKTLNALIEDAGLLGTLSSDKEFTIFAPSDAALANFLAGNPAVAESLEDRDTLKNLLLNHVTAGKLPAKDVRVGKMSVTNLAGNELEIEASHSLSDMKVAGIPVGRHDLYVMDNIIVHEIEDVISKFASTEPSSPEPRPTPLPVPPRGALDPLPAEILGQRQSVQDGLRKLGLSQRLGLNTLATLLEEAGLVEALSSDSDLTLFAPSDEALQKLIGSGSLPTEPSARREAVKAVLLNHVISGKVESGDITDGLLVRNLAGNDLPLDVSPEGVTVGGARVSRTDFPLLKLTVHILDDVIDPENLGTPIGSKVGSREKLQEILESKGLNTLNALLENAELVEALSGDSDLTLFAPTDEALQRFIGSLPSAPDAETLKTVLLNHVISGNVGSGDITDGLKAENLAGKEVTLRINPKGVTVGGARVAETDIPINKLKVHIINDVINPNELGTLQEGLKGLGLTKLATALEDAGLVQTLRFIRGTLFGPTNEALERYWPIMPLDNEVVKSLLLNHVIPGKVFSDDITDGMTARNLAGEELTIETTPEGVIVGGARVGRVDEEVLNLVVHVLDDVINPTQLK